MDGTIATLLIGVVTNGLYDIVKDVAKRKLRDQEIKSIISESAYELDTMHEGIDSIMIAIALKQWCSSDEFKDLISTIDSGDVVDVVDSKIVENFRLGGEWPDETPEDALQDILVNFLPKLNNLLYSGSQGIERIARVTVKQAEGIRDHISEAIGTLANRNDLRELSELVVVSQIEKSIKDRLQIVRSALGRGHFMDAENVLLEIETDIKRNAVSSEIQFEHAMIFGQHFLNQTKLDRSAYWFKSAIRSDPDNADVAYARALIAMSEGSKEASNLAKVAFYQHEYPDKRAARIYLVALDLAGRLHDALELVPKYPWILEDANCLYSIGNMYGSTGNLDKCVEYHRLAVQRDGTNGFLTWGLGASLLHTVEDDMRRNVALKLGLTPQLRDRLTEALDCFEKALAMIDPSQDHSVYVRVLNNRGVAYQLLGQDDFAIRDYMRVLELAPDSNSAKLNLGHVYIEQQKYNAAINLLENVADDSEFCEAAILGLVESYDSLGKCREVIERLMPFWRSRKWILSPVVMAVYLLDAADKCKDPEAQNEVLTDVSKGLLKETESKYLKAHQLRREQANAESIQVLQEIVECNSSSLIASYKLELADLLYTEKRYAEAAAIYKEYFDAEVDSIISRRYLMALFLSGQLLQAFNTAKLVKADGEIRIPSLEIMGHILGRREMWNEALQVHSELIQLDPNNPVRKLALAECAINCGNHALAKEQLSLLKPDQFNDPFYVLVAANLKMILGESDAIEYAFYAMKRFSASVETYMSYLQIYLRIETVATDILSVSEVTSSSIVAISSGSETRTVYFGESNSVADNQIQILIDSALAKSLLGLKLGDEFSLDSSIHTADKWEIISVKNKYVEASAHIFRNFKLIFPNSEALVEYKINVNDAKSFDPIIARLSQQHSQLEDILSSYQRDELPVYPIAKTQGLSVFEFCNAILYDNSIEARVSGGSLSELQWETKVLTDSESVILEPMSLCVLEYLGLLSVLPKAFPRILVAPGVLKEVSAAYAERTSESGQRKFLHVHAGQLIGREISDEQWHSARARFQAILSFLQDSCEFLSEDALVLHTCEEFSSAFEELFGSSLDLSIRGSIAHSSVFCCDDYVTRSWVHNLINIKIVSVQSLLEELLRRKVITENQFHENFYKLSQLNYGFLRVTPETVCWAIKAVKSSSMDLQQLFERICDNRVEVDRMIGIVGVALVCIYTEIMIPAKRAILTDCLLTLLVRGRNSQQIFAKLRDVLCVWMSLLPIHRDALFKVLVLIEDL